MSYTDQTHEEIETNDKNHSNRYKDSASGGSGMYSSSDVGGVDGTEQPNNQAEKQIMSITEIFPKIIGSTQIFKRSAHDALVAGITLDMANESDAPLSILEEAIGLLDATKVGVFTAESMDDPVDGERVREQAINSIAKILNDSLDIMVDTIQNKTSDIIEAGNINVTDRVDQIKELTDKLSASLETIGNALESNIGKAKYGKKLSAIQQYLDIMYNATGKATFSNMIDITLSTKTNIMSVSRVVAKLNEITRDLILFLTNYTSTTDILFGDEDPLSQIGTLTKDVNFECHQLISSLSNLLVRFPKTIKREHNTVEVSSRSVGSRGSVVLTMDIKSIQDMPVAMVNVSPKPDARYLEPTFGTDMSYRDIVKDMATIVDMSKKAMDLNSDPEKVFTSIKDAADILSEVASKILETNKKLMNMDSDYTKVDPYVVKVFTTATTSILHTISSFATVLNVLVYLYTCMIEIIYDNVKLLEIEA